MFIHREGVNPSSMDGVTDLYDHISILNTSSCYLSTELIAQPTFYLDTVIEYGMKDWTVRKDNFVIIN